MSDVPDEPEPVEWSRGFDYGWADWSLVADEVWVDDEGADCD